MIGGGVINSNNHGFPNIIEIEKEKSSSRAQKIFTSQYLNLGLSELFCDGRSEKLVKSQNHHFHFNHKHKTVKKYIIRWCYHGSW